MFCRILNFRNACYLPNEWASEKQCSLDTIDPQTREFRLPEEVAPRGSAVDPMGSAETAYQGSYDSYNVMSGGDLRVNSKDYVDLPNYARLQDGSRKPITLNMRGAEYIRSSNILKDKRLFGAEYHKTVNQNVQQWKWYNRRLFDSQSGYFN